MTSPQYIAGADLGDLAITWLDTDGDLIDFSTGWAFSVKVGKRGQAAAFTKTTGITPAAFAPNVTIAWSTTGELNSLATGSWVVQITATRMSDLKERKMQTTIHVTAAVS